MDRCIAFRPIPPRSPHLNGKVERSQKTDLDEFWSCVDLKDPELGVKLAEWQHYYNWHRPTWLTDRQVTDGSVLRASSETPFWEDVEREFDRGKQRFKCTSTRA